MLKRQALTGGNFTNPSVPHLHALIILEEEENRKWILKDTELKNRIRDGIRSIKEVYCSSGNPE
ncbi:MAG: hypothetical protein RJQ14_22875, partial [Marinoscillum sp.]